MLSKKSQEQLLKLLKVSDTDITELLGEEEKEFEPKGITILDEEGKTQLLENHAKQNKTAMREIFIKDMKALAGVDFEGKTPEKFIEAFKSHILEDANVKVDDKVKAKDTIINELRLKLDEKDGSIKSLESKFEQFNSDNLLIKHFPKERDDRFTDDDYLTIMRNKSKLHKEDDGTVTFEFNGKKYVDDKLSPLPLATAMEQAFKESNWMKQTQQQKPSGNGFGSNNRVPDSINNMREFQSYCDKNNFNIHSVEAQAKLSEVVKNNPNFNFTE